MESVGQVGDTTTETGNAPCAAGAKGSPAWGWGRSPQGGTDEDSFVIVAWMWSDRRKRSGILKSLVAFKISKLAVSCEVLTALWAALMTSYSTGILRKGFKSSASSVTRNSPNFLGFLALLQTAVFVTLQRSVILIGLGVALELWVGTCPCTLWEWTAAQKSPGAGADLVPLPWAALRVGVWATNLSCHQLRDRAVRVK